MEDDSFVEGGEDISFNDDAEAQPAPPRLKFVDDEEAKEAALRSELAAVREFNELITGVNAGLQQALTKMETVTSAVATANTLLDQYVLVLSQATHNSRLILNGRWQGSAADLAAIEAERLELEQAAQQRLRREQELAAAREREAAAEAARRAAEAKRGQRGVSVTGRKTPGSRSTSAQGGSYGGGYGGNYGISSGSGTGSGTGRGGIPRVRYNTGARGSASGIGRGIDRGASSGKK